MSLYLAPENRQMGVQLNPANRRMLWLMARVQSFEFKVEGFVQDLGCRVEVLGIRVTVSRFFNSMLCDEDPAFISDSCISKALAPVHQQRTITTTPLNHIFFS